MIKPVRRGLMGEEQAESATRIKQEAARRRPAGRAEAASSGWPYRRCSAVLPGTGTTALVPDDG